jgi:hypothetical protein
MLIKNEQIPQDKSEEISFRITKIPNTLNIRGKELREERRCEQNNIIESN